MASGAAAFTGGLGVLKATLYLGLWFLLLPGFVLVTWGVVHALKDGTAPGQK